jgi:penicillin-binding protein 1A
MALPIWAIYMKKVYADKSISISKREFERPEGELTVELDCDKYDKLSVGKQDRFSDTEIEF